MKFNLITKIFFVLSSIVALSGCKIEQPKAKEYVQDNFIILLDLSDRIIKSSDQITRDKVIIDHLYKIYEHKVQKQNVFINSKDRISVVIADQKGQFHINQYKNELYINMDKIEFKDRFPDIEKRRNAFLGGLENLYSDSKISDNKDDYQGADIWKYFNEGLAKDLVNEPNTRNHLIILTDGYYYSKGETNLDPIALDFSNLDVLFLEISPEDQKNELNKIKTTWGTWLESMKISNYSFEKNDVALNQVLDRMDEFLNTNSNTKRNTSEETKTDVIAEKGKETIETSKNNEITDNEDVVDEKESVVITEKPIETTAVKKNSKQSTITRQPKKPDVPQNVKNGSLEVQLSALADDSYNQKSRIQLNAIMINKHFSNNAEVHEIIDGTEFTNQESLESFLTQTRLLKNKITIKNSVLNSEGKIVKLEVYKF